jgi:hypothetical protein
MAILHIDPQDRRRVRQFINLPFEIYRHTPQWVPPISLDVRKPFEKRNPFYRHSQAAFFLALSDQDRAIGRLVVLENRNYNDFNQEKTAFFWLFECVDDPEIASDLFDSGFQWARSQGLNRMIGPRGFTALDGSGLLVKGFEHRPAFGLPYNLAYYPRLIEHVGFLLTGDSVSGYLSADVQLPEKIQRIAELVQTRRGLHIAQLRSRKDLRALVPKLKDLYNDSLGGTTGNVPLTDDEAQALASQLLWFADPRLIKIVLKGSEPVGFLFAYPDISGALQRTGGRVFPFGWIPLLRELKNTEWINVNGAGIIEKYRGLGGTAILFNEMFKSVQGGHFKHADLVQIGIENDKMQRELRDLGIEFYKTHRVYEKKLTLPGQT